ncbi:MAG: 16S rRNA (guanine(527)-N(7))-methyltransferase RsmG [Azospirillum sp.]|nr:16S rRNA (guanine(527)-N(7))-methyltransferase RsmG [Azospirillum sp.]
MTPEHFAQRTGVSRETLEKLKRYQSLLEKWQAKINLVSATTLPELWERHFLDSWQIVPHLGTARRIADLGSGAGFPGLVIAACRPDLELHSVDSDTRKIAFQIDVARELGLTVKFHSARVESLAGKLVVDVVAARALAPLTQLLAWAAPLLASGGLCTFLKGATYESELTQAKAAWHMGAEIVPSLSEPGAALLLLRDPKAK